MSSSIFPRAEIGSAEVLTFEVASERGIYSDGVLSSTGTGAAACVGAPIAGTVLSTAGAAACLATGAALAQAALSAAGAAVATFPGSSLVQGAMTSTGQAIAGFTGLTYYTRLPLGDDPMTRLGEQRDMARPAEGRAMTDGVYDPLQRPGEHRGMTK